MQTCSTAAQSSPEATAHPVSPHASHSASHPFYLATQSVLHPRGLQEAKASFSLTWSLYLVLALTSFSSLSPHRCGSCSGWTPLQHVLPESQPGWIRDVSVSTVYPTLCWEGRISQEQTDEM